MTYFIYTGNSVSRLQRAAAQRKPGNDSFTHPFELSPGSTVFVGETLGASSESADLMNGLSTAVTLWWNWQAPADGTLVVTFSNLYVSVFRGDTLETLQQLDGVRISGQRTTAAGGSALTSSINPLTSNRFPWKTGMAIESLIPARGFSPR